MPITLPARQRRFLPNDFTVTDWSGLEPWFNKLLQAEIRDVDSLRLWLRNKSELDAFLSEDMALRYISMTCNTGDADANARYLFFVEEIQPKVMPLMNSLDKKWIDLPFVSELQGEAFRIYVRGVKNQIRIFREENVPILTELQTLAQEYSGIMGAMSVVIDGKELTLMQASKILQDTDRPKRENAYRSIVERRLRDCDKLEDIFDRMVALRHRVATNAGFDNFRDYMFAALGRFDYTVNDCLAFHKAVEVSLMPLIAGLDAERKKALGYAELRPWDLDTDPYGHAPLKPFESGDELLSKTLRVFETIDPYFSSCLQKMKAQDLFDLESRKGKAPGGYNYPLHETGMPFIFMNAVGSLRDVVTMVHEGGHAVHSFLTAPLELNEFRNFPSEVAELASMSMELLTMEHWQEYFPNSNDLRRAREEHLEDILRTLPWVACIDSFQHWLYTHPEHSREERRLAWQKIYSTFSGPEVNWEGHEQARDYLWHKQLHLFEVPFYYVEYGFAQLGAVAVWKNYLQEGPAAVENYKQALALGYTRSIGDIYRAAGIKFDFSTDYIADLMQLVSDKMKS